MTARLRSPDKLQSVSVTPSVMELPRGAFAVYFRNGSYENFFKKLFYSGTVEPLGIVQFASCLFGELERGRLDDFGRKAFGFFKWSDNIPLFHRDFYSFCPYRRLLQFGIFLQLRS